jgi:hypothetical protein
MSTSRLHVTFGYSAAGSLKLALARVNRSEEVAPLPDDYSMGPIDPGDPDQRADWELEELGEEEPIATSAPVAEFWSKVSSWPGELIVWMSSRCSVELCGLHELVWRLPEANIHTVDVAEREFRSGAAPSYDERQSFAIVRDDRVVEHGLFDVARWLDEVARASLRKRWEQLRQENAPLRVVTDNGLVSAPIDYFDDGIRALITDDWQSCARVVGRMLGSMNGQLHVSASDTFIFVRLLQLIDEDNEIEGMNDEGPDAPWSMQSTRVRRRPPG